MKFKIFVPVVAVAILMGKTNECISAQLQDGGPKDNKLNHPHKSSNHNRIPKVFYDSYSSVLDVTFSASSQGGKVEIYRNGVKVVNTTASADASLSYVLSNYGKGDYTVIVSSGNTVVYSGSYNVK